jgi:hypothetical protein
MHKIVDGKQIELSPQEKDALEAEWKANDAAQAARLAAHGYKHSRRQAYASQDDQLDMIWHSMDKGLPLDKACEFYKHRASVKAQFPKPKM